MSWLAGGQPSGQRQPGDRRAIAVDGKTLRGSGHGSQDSRHLLAALDHAHGVVLGQVEADATTNEIPRFSALCDRIEITGAVITADALHAQHAHAAYLHRRGAHYLLIVKRNQPGLHAQLAALPWRDVPVAYTKRERGHGRTERRTLKVTAVARGLAFPHAAQAIQITRRRKVNGKWSRESCHAVTSLTVTQASPARLAAIHPWPLGDRGPAALGPRPGLRRGPLPDPHRQRAPDHGIPAQPGSHHPATGGGQKPRRGPALPSTQVQPPSLDDHEVLTGFAGAVDGPLPRQPYQKHLKCAGVAGNLHPLHLLDPPGGERAQNDVLVDVVAYPCSPKRRSEQELAARPENTAQLRCIARTVLSGEVVKAATVKADIDGRRPQRRLQQVGSHISRARVPGDGGGQCHGRQIEAGDTPPEHMKMYRFTSEPAANVKCTTR